MIMLRTMERFLKEERGIETPETVTGAWLKERKLPLFVECACCETSMLIFSAMVNDEGFCFCPSCAGEDEE